MSRFGKVAFWGICLVAGGLLGYLVLAPIPPMMPHPGYIFPVDVLRLSGGLLLLLAVIVAADVTLQRHRRTKAKVGDPTG